MTVVYVASPIDQANVESWDRWGFYKQQAKKELVKAGCEVYDPAEAWSTARSDPETIQRVNDKALGSADGVLGFLPDGVPTIGVPVEVCEAAVARTPTVALVGPSSLYSPILHAREVWTFVLGDWEKAVEWLVVRMNDRAATTLVAKRIGQAYVNEVLLEIIRAAAKFPDNTPTNTPSDWFGIAVEEYLEVCQAWNDWLREPKKHGIAALREELVQAGAMSARLYDSIRYLD